MKSSRAYGVNINIYHKRLLFEVNKLTYQNLIVYIIFINSIFST